MNPIPDVSCGVLCYSYNTATYQVRHKNVTKLENDYDSFLFVY